MVEISDPQQLATTINGLPRPLLIGLDVDGTLAPIVAKPDRASLAPGALDALHLLIDRVGVMVAIVSGRPLVDLHGLFELPSGAILVGSHGAEVGTEIDARSDDEQSRIETAETKLRDVVERLPGSWIEQKPLAVALHVREADQAQADAELVQLETEFGDDDDLTLHRGHKVLEVAVRPMSKRVAFDQLRRRLEPSSAIFIGDDASDEGVFESLRDPDVAIKVGAGPTAANERLATPTEVVDLLARLAALE